jgi:hypothetical protein
VRDVYDVGTPMRVSLSLRGLRSSRRPARLRLASKIIAANVRGVTIPYHGHHVREDDQILPTADWKRSARRLEGMNPMAAKSKISLLDLGRMDVDTRGPELAAQLAAPAPRGDRTIRRANGQAHARPHPRAC